MGRNVTRPFIDKEFDGDWNLEDPSGNSGEKLKNNF